mgnify:CR=1 FL=1
MVDALLIFPLPCAVLTFRFGVLKRHHRWMAATTHLPSSAEPARHWAGQSRQRYRQPTVDAVGRTANHRERVPQRRQLLVRKARLQVSRQTFENKRLRSRSVRSVCSDAITCQESLMSFQSARPSNSSASAKQRKIIWRDRDRNTNPAARPIRRIGVRNSDNFSIYRYRFIPEDA